MNPGFVYFLQPGDGAPIKIGWSLEAPEQRRAAAQTYHWEEVRLLASAIGSRKDEQEIHQFFKEHRIRGEWFNPHHEILAFIECVRHRETVLKAKRERFPSIQIRSGEDMHAANWAIRHTWVRRILGILGNPQPRVSPLAYEPKR